jgi:hypothetical protein
MAALFQTGDPVCLDRTFMILSRTQFYKLIDSVSSLRDITIFARWLRIEWGKFRSETQHQRLLSRRPDDAATGRFVLQVSNATTSTIIARPCRTWDVIWAGEITATEGKLRYGYLLLTIRPSESVCDVELRGTESTVAQFISLGVPGR